MVSKHLPFNPLTFATTGEMLALMGPSGSGKTTLLNVLAHRIATSSARVEGNLLVNGQAPTLAQFQALSSYVEQEDVLLGSLTVYETLDFAARIALPRYAVYSNYTQFHIDVCTWHKVYAI